MLPTPVRNPLMVALLALACLWRPDAARAEGEFVVESANAQLDETVYFLNAVLAIKLPHYIVSAIDQGFDLPLLMEIEVYRHEPLWFDERVVYIKHQYRVAYHALLDEFSLLDVNSGMRTFFPSLDRVLGRLSVLLHYPALDRNSLLAGEDHRIRLRFGIDAAELPLPLKSSSLWKNDWELRSDWFEWKLGQ